MSAALLYLLALQAGAAAPPLPEVPPALTEVVPALALRWRELPLERDGQPVSALVPGKVAVAAATAWPGRRVRGAFPAGGARVASRVFGSEDGHAEVPLPPLEPSQSDFLVVLPPVLAPTPVSDGQSAPAAVGLTLPA